MVARSIVSEETGAKFGDVKRATPEYRLNEQRHFQRCHMVGSDGACRCSADSLHFGYRPPVEFEQALLRRAAEVGS